MSRMLREDPITTNRTIVGLGIIIAAFIAIGIPRSPALPREYALKVDPNHTPPQVLEALPGLGPVKVKAIVGERQRSPFRSADDLDRRVKGIGPVTARALKPFLRFDASKP